MSIYQRALISGLEEDKGGAQETRPELITTTLSRLLKCLMYLMVRTYAIKMAKEESKSKHVKKCVCLCVCSKWGWTTDTKSLKDNTEALETEHSVLVFLKVKVKIKTQLTNYCLRENNPLVQGMLTLLGI